MRAPDTHAVSSPDPPTYRFADVVIDTHARTVERAGEALPLEPKAYGVLLALLRRPGELLARETLLDEVWGHRHVTPGVLTRAIAQLRHALGDDPHEPRYIRTRHALGYCFIGRLEPEPLDDAGAGTGSDASGDAGASGIPVEQAAAVPMPGARPVRAAGAAAATAGAGGMEEAVAPPASSSASAVSAATGAPAAVIQAPRRQTDVPPQAPLGRRAADRRPRWLPLVLVAIAGIASLLLGARLLRPASAVEPSIAVLPFAGIGGADGERYFAEGLAVEMHDALATVPGLQVVAVRGLRPGDRDPRELGRRLGVAHLLDARVRREGTRVRVTAWLTDTRTGVTRWSGRFDREASSVFAVQGEVAGEVVRALKGVVPGANLEKRLRPTEDFAAYDAYLQGLQALAPGGGDSRLAAAADFFEQALRRDPSFARARAGLCRAELARFEGRLDAVAFARAERACRQAAANAPQLREVDLALGELHRMRGDHPRAIEHYRRSLDDIGLRVPAHVGLARSFAGLRDPTASARHFAAALRLQPNDAAVHREYGFQRYLDGDMTGAIASYRRAVALAPGDERLWSSLGGLLLAAGDTDAAQAAFERSLALRPSYAALSNYGSLRYEARDYAAAEALYRRAAALDGADFRLWGNLGDATTAQPGQAARARAAYERAAGLAADYVAIRDDDAQALALLAWYRANLADPHAAREALARAEHLAREPAEVAFLGAQVHALLGDRAAARERIARAAAHGIPERRLVAAPLLAPLVTPGVASR